MYSFNGMYLMGGQERFFVEITKELDLMIPPGTVEILIPEWEKFDYQYQNIEVKRIGKSNKLIWLQYTFPKYIKENKNIPVSLFNHCSVINPGIGTIHDLAPIFYKPERWTFHGELSKRYWEICRNALVKKGRQILTVSEKSKSDILNIYNIDPNRIIVLGNGWQHMNRIQETPDIFGKFTFLQKGKYYFSLGSITQRKNIKWIINVAKNNPDDIFVIAGSLTKYVNASQEMKADNIIYIGRVSDEDMKALMRNCKAFLFPSVYEGFGIPPLEALSTGAKIVVANASCLPEIYGNCAHYIDPYKYDIDLNALLEERVDDPSSVLEKYTWKNMANILKDLLFSNITGR